MLKKPDAIDASTGPASKNKPAIIGSLRRGLTATENLVDLNFKVPMKFRQRFKRHAFDAGLKNVQLLTRALDAWEKEQAKNGPT